MIRGNKLDRLPDSIKAKLIEKILCSPDSYEDILSWLERTTGKHYSKSSVWRFAQTLRSLHGALIELGLSREAIADNAGKLEKLGAYLVRRELLNRRIEALQREIFEAKIDKGD